MSNSFNVGFVRPTPDKNNKKVIPDIEIYSSITTFSGYKPTSIAIDDDGYVYVLIDNSTLRKYNPLDLETALISTSVTGGSGAIVIWGNYLYLSDSAYLKRFELKTLTLDASILFPSSSSGPGIGMAGPAYMEVDDSGVTVCLISTQHSIAKYNLNCSLRWQYTPGVFTSSYPLSWAFSNNNDGLAIYLGKSSGQFGWGLINAATGTISVSTQYGTLTQAPSPAVFLHSDGCFYAVCAYSSGFYILKINSSGTVVSSTYVALYGIAQTGFCRAGDGFFIVASLGRIFKIDKDGIILKELKIPFQYSTTHILSNAYKRKTMVVSMYTTYTGVPISFYKLNNILQ